jgi:putative copper resistance protein D
MDVWIVINPILKVLLYAASFLSVGIFLFRLHFAKHLTVAQNEYCNALAFKAASVGVVTSLLMVLSVAGNLGGDIDSVVEPLMLQLALESKSGTGYLTAFLGFTGMLIANRLRGYSNSVGSLVSSATILLSFTMSGHSQLGGFLSQSLLMIHLFGIAFWLGALFPFRWMCLQPDPHNLNIIAHRFGVFALGYVSLLLSAGLGYAYLLLGDVSLLFATQYGNVLLVKVMLVVSLLSLAALNKFKLVPSLESKQTTAVMRFHRAVQFEIAIAVIILTTSSLLTTSMTLPMGM